MSPNDPAPKGVKLLLDKEPTTLLLTKSILWKLSIRRKPDIGLCLEVECSPIEEHTFWECDFHTTIETSTDEFETTAEPLKKSEKFSNYTNIGVLLPLADGVNGVKLNVNCETLQVYDFPKSARFDEPVEHISDITMIVEGQKLYACKKILATYSWFFYDLFSNEPLKEEFLVENAPCNSFRVFLGLLYNYNNLLTVPNFPTIAQLSSRFVVDHCLEECEKFLITADISPAVSLGLAQGYDFKVLHHHVLSKCDSFANVMNLDATFDFDLLGQYTINAMFARMTELRRGKSANPENGEFKQRVITFTESEPWLTDIVLSVGDKKYHVSKQLLAYHSSYFKTLFYSDFNEKRKDEIELKEIDADEFEVFLQFVQYPNREFNEKTIEPVLKLADIYDVNLLTEKAEKFLIHRYMSHAWKIELAHKYNLPKVMENVASKIECLEDFKDLSYEDGFERLTVEMLGQFAKLLLES